MNPCFFKMSHWDFRALHSFVFRNCQHSALRGWILQSNALMGSKLPAGCPFQGPEYEFIASDRDDEFQFIFQNVGDHNSHNCPSKFPLFSLSYPSYGVPFHGFSGWLGLSSVADQSKYHLSEDGKRVVLRLPGSQSRTDVAWRTE